MYGGLVFNYCCLNAVSPRVSKIPASTVTKYVHSGRLCDSISLLAIVPLPLNLAPCMRLFVLSAAICFAFTYILLQFHFISRVHSLCHTHTYMGMCRDRNDPAGNGYIHMKILFSLEGIVLVGQGSALPSELSATALHKSQ